MADDRDITKQSVGDTFSEDPNAISEAPSANSTDPTDEIPVPIAMSAAEIDERAQAVDAVRRTAPHPMVDDELRTGA